MERVTLVLFHAEGKPQLLRGVTLREARRLGDGWIAAGNPGYAIV